MMAIHLAMTTPRAKTTWDRLNPIDAHLRLTPRRFTPRAARAIPKRDHFTPRNRQRQGIAYDIHVVEQEHLPTSVQQFVMPRDAFLFRPQPAHHATARFDRRTPFTLHPLLANTFGRPAHPRRVTPVARLHRDEAAVLRWQRSRRGSRPRQWHVRRESHPPALAVSRPLHARTAVKRPCDAGNGRATASPARVARASRAPPVHPRRVTSVACGTSRCRAPPARNGRTAAPAPASREGCRDRYRSAARPCGLCVS